MSDEYHHAKFNLALVLTRVVNYIQRVAQKAIVDDYGADITRIAEGGIAGSQSEGEVETKIKRAIVAFALAAFLDGMAQEGAGEGDMTADDRAKVTDFILLQSGFAAGLAGAIIAARSADDKEAARRDVLARVVLWIASLEVLRLQGVASAGGDKMVTWRYGDTDHCETCLGLNGTRRRLSWFVERGYIPRQPNSDTLDCGGWNCQCGLFADDGSQVM